MRKLATQADLLPLPSRARPSAPTGTTRAGPCAPTQAASWPGARPALGAISTTAPPCCTAGHLHPPLLPPPFPSCSASTHPATLQPFRSTNYLSPGASLCQGGSPNRSLCRLLRPCRSGFPPPCCPSRLVLHPVLRLQGRHRIRGFHPHLLPGSRYTWYLPSDRQPRHQARAWHCVGRKGLPNHSTSKVCLPGS